MASESRSAIISAVAGIAGAVFGGFSTYLIQDHLTTRQFHHDDQQALAVARAAARLEEDRLERADGLLEAMLLGHRYVATITVLRTDLGVEDRKLIAGYVDGRTWTAMTNADVTLELVRDAIQEHAGTARVPAAQLRFLAAARHTVREAVTALVRWQRRS